MPGTVVARVYVGTSTQVIVEIAEGVRLVALEQNFARARSDDRWEIGSRVTLGWHPGTRWCCAKHRLTPAAVPRRRAPNGATGGRLHGAGAVGSGAKGTSGRQAGIDVAQGARGIGGVLAGRNRAFELRRARRAAAHGPARETLWSISAANNLTTRTVAVYNGLPETAQLLVGTTVYVPTVAEGAAALASGAPAVATPSIAAPAARRRPSRFGPLRRNRGPAPGMGSVPSPSGQLHSRPRRQMPGTRCAPRLSVPTEPTSTRWPGFRLPHLPAAGRALRCLPGGRRGAGQPAGHLLPRARDGRGRRNAANAVAGRPDRMEVRLGQAPRAGRVVASTTGRLTLVALTR